MSDQRHVEPIETDPPERTTGPQEALDKFHDERSPLGRVQRVCLPVDEDDEDDEAGEVLHDADPFERE